MYVEGDNMRRTMKFIWFLCVSDFTCCALWRECGMGKLAWDNTDRKIHLHVWDLNFIQNAWNLWLCQ